MPEYKNCMRLEKIQKTAVKHLIFKSHSHYDDLLTYLGLSSIEKGHKYVPDMYKYFGCKLLHSIIDSPDFSFHTFQEQTSCYIYHHIEQAIP